MNVIIGLGTGRCGTVSLSRLLNLQEKSKFSHELQRLPWVIDKERFNKLYQRINLKEFNFVGDVSFYNLPYINLFLKKNKNTKFILLKRDREEVVRSFLKKTKTSNHFQKGAVTKHIWDECFPRFEAKDKAEAIEKYYDHYYDLSKEIPNDNIFKINTLELNNKNKCMEMLNFCGFTNPTVDNLFWENRGG